MPAPVDFSDLVQEAALADSEGRLHEFAGLTKDELSGLVDNPERRSGVTGVGREDMADDATETDTTEASKEDDQRVPYERFQKANQQAKEAKDRAAKLERDFTDLKAQLEEREQQGLPELDQLKKRAEAAEKKAAEAEERAEREATEASNVRKQQWISAAAQTSNFIDPDDAVRNVDLSSVEDKADAERAVKAVAKAKEHLIKKDDPKLPGRVLKDGQRTTQTDEAQGREAQQEQARAMADELASLVGNQWK